MSGQQSGGKALKASTGSGLAINAFFILWTLLCIVPFILVIAVSFSDENTILANGYKFIPDKFSLSAYEYIIKDKMQVLNAYRVSITVTITGTLLSLLITALYAYPLSRTDLPYRGFFSFYVFFTLLFNGGLVPFYFLYVMVLGLKNSMLALILPLLLQPFFVIIMRTFFQTSIPPAVIEAAKIDGAGEIGIFWRIIIPLSMPVIASVGLFTTLNYWNDWFLSLLFIEPGNNNVGLQYLLQRAVLNIQYITQNSNVSQYLSGQDLANLPNRTLQMAMAVVGIGPIIFAYPFFQKYFVKGLTVGAVKG
ncbi:putative aldouronate transport system permease protein [Paenibacillus sp. UNCCL117]|uniref:carbohydrate ABC transporter permease n=1 Tax=unclassified Paenibacillus TaxID=185978 RepID=UPI00088975FF|nr:MULTISPECIES: carbohydrate ABC transporter permease [unclassified Paenibacillus]SDD40595.1 putative aldouronate transport system permease protein [Paenibacillus sp. cl123]SFW48058.1 putative aldouronate transport system permease protein [Paenibacillus sp. UNCCL117]